MILFLSMDTRRNFTSMARMDLSCERRYRDNFKNLDVNRTKANRYLISNELGWKEKDEEGSCIVAVDASFIQKHGKKTADLGNFWSGKDGRALKWFEILECSVVRVSRKGNEAMHLFVEQTLLMEKAGEQVRTEDSGQGDKDKKDPEETFVNHYVSHIEKHKDKIMSSSRIIAGDAYFSKSKFVNGVTAMGFTVVSWFRHDVNLHHTYDGPKSKERGRPRKYGKKVNLENDLDTDKFKTKEVTDASNPTFPSTETTLWLVLF